MTLIFYDIESLNNMLLRLDTLTSCVKNVATPTFQHACQT